MNYSRVALLLALALAGRTTDAWVIDTEPTAMGKIMMLQPPALPGDFLNMDPCQPAVHWPGDKPTESDVFSASSLYFCDYRKQLQSDCAQLPYGNDGASAGEPKAQFGQKFGIDQQLARLLDRGVLLLKARAKKASAYVSHYWQQTVAYVRDRCPKAEWGGLDRLDMSANSNLSSAEAQQQARRRLARLTLIDYLYGRDRLGSSVSVNGIAVFMPVEDVNRDVRRAEQSPAVPSTVSRLVLWVKRSLEELEATFRNTTYRFAQLNWAVPFHDQAGDRAAGNAMRSAKAIER